MRIPRYKGLTFEMRRINQIERDKKRIQAKNDLKAKLIRKWMNEGMQWQGTEMGMMEMQEWLGIRNDKHLVRIMIEEGGDVSIKEANRAESYLKAITGQLGTLMTGRAYIHKVVHQLMAEHSDKGKKYLPFVTSELNSALKSLIAHEANTTQLIKLLEPTKGSINIEKGVLVGNDNGTPTKGISIEEAVLLLDQKTPPLLAASTNIQNLIAEQGPIPEVLALRQNTQQPITEPIQVIQPENNRPSKVRKERNPGTIS